MTVQAGVLGHVAIPDTARLLVPSSYSVSGTESLPTMSSKEARLQALSETLRAFCSVIIIDQQFL